jgi:hypothetical protein
MPYPTIRQQMSFSFVRHLESTYTGANVALGLQDRLPLWVSSNSNLLANNHRIIRFIVDSTSLSHSNIIRRRFLEEADLIGWFLHPHGFWESTTPIADNRAIRILTAGPVSAAPTQH